MFLRQLTLRLLSSLFQPVLVIYHYSIGGTETMVDRDMLLMPPVLKKLMLIFGVSRC